MGWWMPAFRNVDTWLETAGGNRAIMGEQGDHKGCPYVRERFNLRPWWVAYIGKRHGGIAER